MIFPVSRHNENIDIELAKFKKSIKMTKEEFMQRIAKDLIKDLEADPEGIFYFGQESMKYSELKDQIINLKPRGLECVVSWMDGKELLAHSKSEKN